MPAHGKRTFYNGLRQHPENTSWKRSQSHTATMNEKKDVFSRSQNHFNHKYLREMNLVSNYQRMLDERLSKPKITKEDQNGKVYKNSAQPDQKLY